jgi:hypothetical protein
MHLSLQSVLRSCVALLLGCLVSIPSTAMATSVQFSGTVGYSSDYASFTVLAIDGIRNSSSTTSASLRVELWASAQPFSGSFATSFRMAVYTVGPVAAGATTPKITQVVPAAPLPAGTWYFAMVLTEYAGAASNDGYVERGHLNFAQTVYIKGTPPPADTTAPTASIASPTSGNVSGTVTISANASDNVGVTRVDFYVNGSKVGSDSAAPYQYAWNTTTQANGNATLRAVAVDAAGNSGQSALVTVNVANVVAPPPDTTPPTASIASPTSGNVSGAVTVSANAADNVGVTRVEFYVNGALAGTDAAAPYQYSWNTAALANGSATLFARAFDAAGNSRQSASVTVTVANVVAPPPDTTKPTVSIASPTSGNVAGTVTVSANAADNVGVTRVEFYVNGALAGTDAAAPYQYSWNTATRANGAATLFAKAFDAAGNSTQSASVTVTVANVVAPPPDTTKPTVNIASPTSGNVAGTVTVSANAADNVGVIRVEFYVNGALAGTDAAAPYQYSWNTAARANGSATLYAKAFDAAGNATQSASVTVMVANAAGTPPADTTKPTVSIASPRSGTVSGTVTVASSATDNVGVAWVALLVNGTTVGVASKAPYGFAWNSRSVVNGAAKIELYAMDAANNGVMSAPVYVTVANGIAPASMKLAVEYYNEELDHYFITAMDAEIDALDAGHFAGWSRTGSSIDVYDPGSGDGSPVCRFYLPPEYGNSHFYSASQSECAQVAQKFPDFAFESTEVFRAVTPDFATGQCPENLVPVYRLWNNREDSNHRYTSDRPTRDEMVAKGYVAEGYGPEAVIMCGTP